MTDCFALLGVPRRLLLDPAELQHRFHALAAERHPDAHAAGSSSAGFAELNAAHQTLLDPRTRLLHFLALAGETTSHAPSEIPPALGDLFFAISAAQDRLRRFAEKRSAESSIARALAAHEAAQLTPALTALLAKVDAQHQTALEELARLDSAAPDLPAIAQLAQQLGYLDRWRGKLREDLLQLSGVPA